MSTLWVLPASQLQIHWIVTLSSPIFTNLLTRVSWGTLSKAFRLKFSGAEKGSLTRSYLVLKWKFRSVVLCRTSRWFKIKTENSWYPYCFPTRVCQAERPQNATTHLERPLTSSAHGFKRGTYNPLATWNTGFHSFARAMLPGLGGSDLEKATVDTLQERHTGFNATGHAVQAAE